MSYQIGQFRKEMKSNYLNQFSSFHSQKVKTSTQISTDIYFQDIGFLFDGGQSFEHGKNYYVKLKIKRRLTNDFNFTLVLQERDESQVYNEQFLKTFYLPKLQNNEDINDSLVVEVVFNPLVNFNYLTLKLNRTAEDFNIKNDDKSAGRFFEVVEEECNCYQIENVISSIAGVNEFIKIGVQGPSGFLMCINGEEIRIGPSGIYQIKNGYKINFIGFIITAADNNSSNNYFILDYQY